MGENVNYQLRGPKTITNNDNQILYYMYIMEIYGEDNNKITVKVFTGENVTTNNNQKIKDALFINEFISLICKTGIKDYIFLGDIFIKNDGYEIKRDYILPNGENAESFFKKNREHIKANVEQELQSKQNAKHYVCSDIHGMYGSYRKAINILNPHDHLFILGDATDRGKHGIKIILDIMERQNKDGKTPRVTYILGNHDWWLIKAIGIIKKYDLKTEELKEILQNEDSIKQIGVLKETRPSSTILLEDIKFLKLYAHIIKGEETIIDFSELPKEQQIKVEEFLKNSSIFISKKIGGKNIALAHAVPFELNTEGKLYQDIKYRDIDSEIAIIEFLQTDIEKVKDRIQAYKDGGFLTIVGHMAQSNGLIKRNDGYIIVDAACSGYGRLALYCIEDDKEIYIDPKEDVGGSVGGNR